MKIGKINREQILKANKKASREIVMGDMSHKIHKSKKYELHRKRKHKGRDEVEYIPK